MKICPNVLTSQSAQCEYCGQFLQFIPSFAMCSMLCAGFSSNNSGLDFLQCLTYPVLAMVHPQWFTCDYLLAMATRNNHDMKMYELSMEKS